MSLPVALLFGALAGAGVFAMVLALRRPAGAAADMERLRVRRYKAQAGRHGLKNALSENAVPLVLSLGAGTLAWFVTGWPVATLLGLVGGFIIPRMLEAPRKRQAITDEIEAYAMWAEQIRDLVGASGSLFEAVALSAENAPAGLRRPVQNLVAMSRTVGLPAALDWFAGEMRSPFADRIVLGMKIAWDSGARVTEAFESTARGMRAEVEMRRRNEVANGRAWTQVTSILAVTVLAVGAMFLFNRGFFDPFGTLFGQVMLLGVGVLIFGNVFWVMKLAESGLPIRLLSAVGSKTAPAASAPASEAGV